MSLYRDIEGVVKRIGANALIFRFGDDDHDTTVPRADVENFDTVQFGDNWISVSRNFLRKREREE